MNSLRKTVGFLMMLMLAAFALPSGAAQQKLFNAVIPNFITVTSSPNPVITTIAVKFNNTSPGNSTINSISIAVLPGGDVSISQANCAANTLGTGTLQAGACVITGFNGILSSSSATFNLQITVAANKACANATWVVNANTGNAYPQGTPFTPIDQQLFSRCDGTLACGGSFGPDNSSEPGTVFGIRGLFNKDGKASSGTCGAPVAYANDLLDAAPGVPQTNHYQWDTAAQPNAAFTYTINWKLSSLPQTPGQWPAKHPKVSWTATSASQTSLFDPALACLGPVNTLTPPYGLPAPYGTVVSATLTSTTATIVLDTTGNFYTLPPAVGSGFPIIIGTERMQVTAVSGSGPYTLTATRHTGGTTPYSPQVGDRVMYTPMPIYPDTTDYPNYRGQQAHMCVADQEWMPAGLDPLTGNLRFRYSTTFVDQGDSWTADE